MTHEKKDPPRQALGRGLASLLPERKPTAPPVAPEGRPVEIPLHLIERNPFQTRTRFDEKQLQELADSIVASGVIQPIIVRSLDDGRYQLIAGERRLLASKKAGQQTIPSIIRDATDERAMEMTIVENLQRADLNPMEQARAYQRLSHEFKMTQEQMAVRTGKERASVTNFLRLLRLPIAIQEKVEEGTLSFGHARTLLSLETPEQMTSAAQKITALAMSVRQTETFVQGLLHPKDRPLKPQRQAPESLDANVKAAQDRLQRALGLKVKIEDKHGRGKVIIEYARLEDFDTLLSLIDGNQDAS